ncbi:uncharacterized protein PGTG_05624 [Puccinia graminis f. sp. tritici CRL 75-36-700-3]|uniref:Tet-like 2OG-Fe(II) oxygenase domain-containing protein n=1 Tax=Puccinia graminis f. sp. tritici (strain CRL 75-36-700-3 / race SCCL) TaxID=418459 RepID=E3K4Y8_PUCGT|nr:uncharacterized protein PGTG_05624 [Puccinia graminis f. sp. tritici CRL 75-36-700-3]EFP79303.1 hypothetical protein PGTG_05624 [Puccinia graminis f. sp. tritici CRL 75-36-700-3]
MTKHNLNQATNSSELVSDLTPGNMIHRRSLSDLASTLTELSISSDSDDQPIASLKDQVSHEGTVLRQAPNHQTTSKKPLKTLVNKESKNKSSYQKAYRKRKSQEHRPKRRRNACVKAIRSHLANLPLQGPFVISRRIPKRFVLYPEVTREFEFRKEERRIAQENFANKIGPQPPDTTIYERKPTPEEIKQAYDQVNDSFDLYDHGHVTVFDNSDPKVKDKIIAAIHFTDLTKLTPLQIGDINFLCKFLQDSKRFVNPVSSPSRLCAGKMWAIGWRKSMTKLEIVGIYRNRDAIKKNKKDYLLFLDDAERAGRIVWDLFHPVGNIALEKNQQFMIEHNIPGFYEAEFPNEKSKPSKEFFSSNLTFTSNGFFNHPHKDKNDHASLPFAFLLSLPISKETGLLAYGADEYDVTEGPFIFRDCQFGIKFRPNTMCQMIFSQREYSHCTLAPSEPSAFSRLGLSLQISAKMVNISDRITGGEFDNRKDMHIAGAEYNLNVSINKSKAPVQSSMLPT